MTEPIPQQLVAFTRNGYEQVATTVEQLFEDAIDDRTDPPRLVRGRQTPFVGLRLDNGLVVYEHVGECEPIDNDRATEIRERGERAREAINADRAELWHGGGSTVYTK